jgi:hypothetical protein
MLTPSNTDFLPQATDTLAKRDGYRLWCQGANVEPDLPARFDAGWCFTESFSSASLVGSIQLFSGLMAARAKDFRKLEHFDTFSRKWCLSVAATQPSIPSFDYGAFTRSSDLLLLLAYSELQTHLESQFLGVWSRLRLLLADVDITKLSNFHSTHNADNAAQTMFSSSRAQRCWRMCLNRYMQTESDTARLSQRQVLDRSFE